MASFVFQPINETFVRNQLNTLKSNKAIGLDRISGRLLKDASEILTTSLTLIFNRSLQIGIFPNI